MGNFRSLKLTLKYWNKYVFRDLDSKINTLKNVVSNWDLLADNNSLYAKEVEIIYNAICDL